MVIDATIEKELVQALDSINFLSLDKYDVNSVVSIIDIPVKIFKQESEIISENQRVFKYTGESVFSKIKSDITYQPVSGQTCKDIVIDIIDNAELNYDDSLYSISLAFQGDRVDGSFGKFEEYNSLNMIYNLLAIDGMVMSIKDDNTIFFVPNNRDNNISITSFSNLVKNISVDNIYKGIKVYSSEAATSVDSLLADVGENGKTYVSLFFNNNANTQAQAFSENLVNNFSEPLESISFNSKENYQLGDCFNINLANVEVSGDYMLERKQIRIESGSINYTYRAYKKNQMIQFFHNKSFIDSIFRYNNTKRPANLTISESLYDDGTNVRTLSIDTYSVFIGDFGIPTVRITFNKKLKPTISENDFRLKWGA